MRSIVQTISVLAVISLLLIQASCKKAEEYFKDPETEPIAHTLITSAAIGYTASIAMSAMAGEQIDQVLTVKSCSGFPCAALIYIDIAPGNPVPFSPDNNGSIIIAGLWPSAEEAILTLFFYDLDIKTSSFTLKNVHTFPVTSRNGKILAVFAGMDINIGSNPLFPVKLDITEGEINIELARLDLVAPGDIYVAVEQHAYFIEIDQNSTPALPGDDIFIVTGGGQIIEVKDDTGGIIQQALLDVELNASCLSNPMDGFALIKNTKAGESLPELGTAIFEFHPICDGMALVSLATGVYVRSNGKLIPLGLD